MRKSAKKAGPTDGQIFRRALGIGLCGVGLVTAVTVIQAGPDSRAAAFFRRFVAPRALAAVAKAAPAPSHLLAEPLNEELRKKGFHECYPHDPIGLGPYTPFKNLSMGRIAMPQSGAHTPDMGYDVLIQFHGHSPVRKTLVQVARGVVYVGIDKGLGSGPYSDAFGNPDVFQALCRSIEAALKRHSGDERAHIRHLALSAWSAGYGAVNEILKYGNDRVDAVILLDGLHAGWNPAARDRDAGVSALSSQPLAPTFRFAKKAALGEKIFVFTHSDVNPETYPSTRQTADLMLHELGLTRTAVDPGGERFGQWATVDHQGFHLWSFKGANELAHCSHIPHVARALYLLEDAWDTPAMDRSVPFTPAPILGSPDAGLEAHGDQPTADSPLTAALLPSEPVEILAQPAATDEPSTPAPAETKTPIAPPAPPEERPSGTE